MSPMSAIDAGLQGIQQGMNGMRRNAHEIASAGVRTAASAPASPGPDMVQSLVELKLNQLQAQASTKVVQSASDMLGSLIDLRA